MQNQPGIRNRRQALGARLATARRHAGLTQGDMADAIGASRGTVHSWEKGRSEPGATQLLDWAEATGFEPMWLLEGTADQSPPGLRVSSGKQGVTFPEPPTLLPAA